MLNITELNFTSHDLADAVEWGDGWCLACGERANTVQESVISECDSCGAVAVISGVDLNALRERLNFLTLAKESGML